MKSAKAFDLQQSVVASTLHQVKALYSGQTAVNLSSLVLAAFCSALVLACMLLVLGVNFRRPIAANGASLYNPATEVTLQGSVEKTLDFTCPVSEGEMGSHLLLKTDRGTVQVHLAPGRILRSQKISFAPGDQITVIGSRVPDLGAKDLIAREITRGQEDFIFRDRAGNLLLVQ